MVAHSKHPAIIDLTRGTPPPTASEFEPIFVDSDSDDTKAALPVRDTRPRDNQDKERSGSRRKRKKGANVEDGELLESSTPTSSKGCWANGEVSNTKTVRRYDVEAEQHRESGRRKHQRRDNQSRERSPRGSRRSHSPMPHLPPSDDIPPLFFVDVNPTPVIVTDQNPKPDPPFPEDVSKLLLPAHVSVFGSTEGPVPVEILPPSNPHSDDDYIQYLDYNDSKVPGLVRYFDEAVDDMKPTRFMCKNCGLESEHKTSECPVKICLTCGARDEHSTRSCPISKTCFSCGMKGHINRTCPNRYAARRGKEVENYNDCDRCGSEIHKTNECPTWWRIYEYRTDNDREDTLRLREEKRKLGLGEGYIAPDEWCYNCGDCGHLGDDCGEVPHLSDIPGEPSAFSVYNTMSGPFDPATELKPSSSRHRKPRDWERGSGFDASVNVGKEGRKRESARMERKAKQQETNNDPDDWFGNPRDIRSRGIVTADTSSRKEPLRAKKLSFVVKDAGRRFQPPSSFPPTGAQHQRPTDNLLDRLGGDGDRGSSRGRHHDRSHSGGKYSQDHHNLSKQRSGGHERNGDRYDRGPRYKGGYSR